MKKLTSSQIRSLWLRFFESKGHRIEESSSLIPHDDPTLLWTNAGVSPLKKFFDGTEKPLNPRITNAQKCIRTNDIENVGLTARHHTFFEMLGNFSIGDYFKTEAIEFGYELLFSKEWFGFDKDKIYITYYPTDTECMEKWLSLGVARDHLIPLEGNFWEIGEGPCGPDTEIFYDRGKKYDTRGPELIKNDIENDRFIEIWNIVFSQYNSKTGLPRSEYQELPSKNIDTGSGLERLCLVMQGVDTNYETDLFMPIILEISKIANVPYNKQPAFKVIADHVRTVTFAVADGAIISNEGRGYVLRRLLRRAMKFARQLNLYEPFMYNLVDVIIKIMEDYYPYLNEHRDLIKTIIKEEEIKFLNTLKDGEKKLFELAEKNSSLNSNDAFLLYDTYGFPLELTKEYCLDHKINLDTSLFNELLKEQKERARSSRKSNDSMNLQNAAFLEFLEPSLFLYDTVSIDTKIIKIFDEGICLEKTPFYATSGGQEADTGSILNTYNEYFVLDVIKLPNGQHLHILDKPYNEPEGLAVHAVINLEKRNKITTNHSSCHLLHTALKYVLGEHTHQLGQNVNDKQFRFDFNHFKSLTEEEVLAIEDLVNSYINKGIESKIYLEDLAVAKQNGVTALFNEKYGDKVRVVDLGVSKELCSGTHVKNTADLKRFNIINYESIGSGVFRLEGYTGLSNDYLLAYHHNKIFDLDNLNKNLPEPILLDNNLFGYRLVLDLKRKLQIVENKLHELEKLDLQSKKQALLSDLDKYKDLIISNSLVLTLDLDNDSIKTLMDALANKFKLNHVFVLTENLEDIIVYVKSNTNAKDLLSKVISPYGGKGGGKHTFAQGKVKAKLDVLKQTILTLCES